MQDATIKLHQFLINHSVNDIEHIFLLMFMIVHSLIYSYQATWLKNRNTKRQMAERKTKENA